MPINGRVRDIDACLALLVATLNTVPALETLASCCGHGHLPPRVDLADGRVLVVMTKEQADDYYPTFNEVVRSRRKKCVHCQSRDHEGVNIHGEPQVRAGES